MATTWSTTNKNAGVTLGGSNLAATGSGSNQTGASTVSIGAGQKRYYELTINSDPGNSTGFGLVNSTYAPTTATFLGFDTNGVAYFYNGQFWFNSNTTATGTGYTTGAVIGVAVDFDNGHWWFTLDGTNFNPPFATQNPVGNLGGYPIDASGNVFPAYSLGNTGQITGNFGATTFTYSTLFTTLQAAGYSSFDTSGTAYTLTAAEGTYALTGESVTFTAVRSLTAAQGAYALTGESATLTYTQAGSSPVAQVGQPATQSAGAGHGPLRDRSRDKRKPDEYYEIYQQKVNKRHAKRVNAQIRQAPIEDEDYDYLLLAA